MMPGSAVVSGADVLAGSCVTGATPRPCRTSGRRPCDAVAAAALGVVVGPASVVAAADCRRRSGVLFAWLMVDSDGTLSQVLLGHAGDARAGDVLSLFCYAGLLVAGGALAGGRAPGHAIPTDGAVALCAWFTMRLTDTAAPRCSRSTPACSPRFGCG